MNIDNNITFDNEFDLTQHELSKVIIKENAKKDNCFIWDISNSSISYNSFILKKTPRTKIISEVTFYKSSTTKKYIPRLTFKKLSAQGIEKDSKDPNKVIISFNDSESADAFWKLIIFLGSYKDLVDVGEFESIYKIVAKDSFIMEFKTKNDKQKIDELKELLNIANLDFSASDINALTFTRRKENLKHFYYLLKNKTFSNGKDSHAAYREKYGLRKGEEYIWHHFLKKHDWILGLNVDLKFIMDFLDEQAVGIPDSKGRGDPRTDLLGISEFTVLIELKHAHTPIFKIDKSKGRANTWDFSSDFIEGISQCLGQKFELDKIFNQKDFVNEHGNIVSKTRLESIDPKSILLIGNKKEGFPINEANSINLVKNKTLERFRRNNRNIDVLTYDELFERAYHIVFSKKLGSDWYWENENDLFK